MKRSILIVFAFLIASSAFGAIKHPRYRSTVAGAPTCGSPNIGSLISITDGNSGAGDPCQNGGSSEVVLCQCDGTQWNEKGGATAGVSAFESRTGSVVSQAGDYTAPEIDYTPGQGSDWTDPDPTDVDEALEDLVDRMVAEEAGGSVDSVFGRSGAVVAAASDYDANQVDNTPGGAISATDVQGALNELDTEKAPLASPVFTGDPRAPTLTCVDNDTSLATTAYVNSCGGAGSAIVVDIGNDGDDSTDWNKFTTLNDSQGIFSEALADEFEMDFGIPWLEALQLGEVGDGFANIIRDTGSILIFDHDGDGIYDAGIDHFFGAQGANFANTVRILDSGSTTGLQIYEDDPNGTDFIRLYVDSALSSIFSLRLPPISDTLVSKTSTDDLENKTMVTPILSGRFDWTGSVVSDDDCTGDQGKCWWDQTDLAFEFCVNNSGTPLDLSATVGQFSKTSGVVHLTTHADEFAIGTATPLQETAVDSKVTVVGDTDQVQLHVQGNATQTRPIVIIEQSDGDDLLRLANDGTLSLSGDATGAEIEGDGTEKLDIDANGQSVTLGDGGTNGFQVSDAGVFSSLGSGAFGGKFLWTGIAVDDDDCTGDQGKMWWDSTDSAFEICNANSGPPITIGSGGGGGGAFDDTGDPVVLNTTTKDVQIGDAGASNEAGKIEIGGDADQVQILAEGHSTQTKPLLLLQQDDNTSVFEVDNDGTATQAAADTPGFTADDAQDTGTQDGGLELNCATTNDCGWRLWGNAAADTQTDFLFFRVADDGTMIPVVKQSFGFSSGATLDVASAACISNNGSDRLYHDTDCDQVKDGGEEFIDIPSGAASPGGSDTEIQYNDNTVLGGLSFFTVDDVNQDMTFSPSMSQATGDEDAYSFDLTCNKATSGACRGFLMNVTDTASPGALTPLELQVGAIVRFSVNEDGRITIGDGTNTTCLDLSADRIYHDTDCDSTKEAGEEFIDIATASPGGSDTQINYNNAGVLDGLSFFTVDDVNEMISMSPTLDQATGNEVALTVSTTCNKATSGDCTGLDVRVTDTATPGALTILRAGVGASVRFSVNEDGRTTISDGTNDVCLDLSGDRLYHDTDCDSIKDGGEEFLDIPATTAANSFETWDTPLGTDPAADSATDTMQLLGGLDFDITGANDPESITFAHNRDETLAGNPALAAEECVWSKDGTGGSIICEGDTADTNEAVYQMPEADPSADSTHRLLSDLSKVERSTFYAGAGLSPDGTECDAVSTVQINSGPRQAVIACSHTGTEADGYIDGPAIRLPGGFDKTQDMFFDIDAYLTTDSGAGTWHGVIEIQCRGEDDLINNTWTTGGLDLTPPAAAVVNDPIQDSSGAIDTDTTGEDCDPGDLFFWRWKSCDTDATPSTGCTSSAGFENDMSIFSMTVRWSSTLGD